MKSALPLQNSMLKKSGLPKDAIEFQMLYGIRRDLQEQLVKEGYPVRVYVPFGTHWYPYFMRRLAERPGEYLVLRFQFLPKVNHVQPRVDVYRRNFRGYKHLHV